MVPDAGGIPLAPKLFGTYEQEIHPFLEDSIAAEVDLVVNIGAGEGMIEGLEFDHIGVERARQRGDPPRCAMGDGEPPETAVSQASGDHLAHLAKADE